MCSLWLRLSFVCLMPYLLLFIGFIKVSSCQGCGITFIHTRIMCATCCCCIDMKLAAGSLGLFWQCPNISNCSSLEHWLLCVVILRTERENLACYPVKSSMLCCIFIFSFIYRLPVSSSVPSSYVLACLILSSIDCHFVALWKGDLFRQANICPIWDFKHWQIDWNVYLHAFASYCPKECRFSPQVTHVTECPHLTHRRCSCVTCGDVKVWQTVPCWHPVWQMAEWVFYKLIIQNIFCLFSAF